MTDDELPCDPDQQPLLPITPEELDALAGDMEAMYLERGDPSPEEAVAIYRAADEIRRIRRIAGTLVCGMDAIRSMDSSGQFNDKGGPTIVKLCLSIAEQAGIPKGENPYDVAREMDQP